MNQLPVIDIAGLAEGSPSPATVADVAAALEHSGFFYIRSHGIPESVIATLRAQQRAFFACSDAVKTSISINTENRGYLGNGMARMHGAARHDQKEVFFWGAEPVVTTDPGSHLPLQGSEGPVNQWPAEPDGFRDAVLGYSRALAKVGDGLLRVIACALGFEKNRFEQWYTQPMSRGQLIRYPQTQGGSDDFGVAAHTDFGCITLLLQETAGLEVHTRDGEWIPVPPEPGTLVVNIGDLLQRWTDNRLPSTLHRVKNLTGEERFSIAFFHDPNPDAVVDPADLGKNSGQFEAMRAADYIAGRNRGAFSHFGEIAEA